MNICNEFQIIDKCSRQLGVCKHEFAHCRIVNIFHLENFLRYINVRNFTSPVSYVFKHFMARFKITDMAVDDMKLLVPRH